MDLPTIDQLDEVIQGMTKEVERLSAVRKKLNDVRAFLSARGDGDWKELAAKVLNYHAKKKRHAELVLRAVQNNQATPGEIKELAEFIGLQTSIGADLSEYERGLKWAEYVTENEEAARSAWSEFYHSEEYDWFRPASPPSPPSPPSPSLPKKQRHVAEEEEDEFSLSSEEGDTYKQQRWIGVCRYMCRSGGYKYRAVYSESSKQFYIATFNTAERAARAHDRRARSVFGPDARTNYDATDKRRYWVKGKEVAE